MAIQWGAWEGSGNAMRVGIDVTWTAGDGGSITNSTQDALATVEYWTENNNAWSDDQSLNLGGAIDGTISFHNGQGDGVKTRRGTRTYKYSYAWNEYGSSPGSRTFSATLQGAYNGITPSKSVSSDIPARPIAAPDSPTNASVSRVSDTSQKISWTNRNKASAPWETVRVQWDVADNGVWNGDVAVLGGGATSTTHSGTVANAAYRYRVRSENSKGVSSWDGTALILTSPAVPTSVTRSPSGTDQVVSWTNQAGYAEYNTEVWRAVDGTWSLLATKASGVGSHTDLAPDPAKKVKYRVRHKTTAGVQGTLYSTFSAETTETAGVTSPPNPPTKLAPSGGVIINPTQIRTFSWQYNSTDGTAQTAYQVQWRTQGSTTWTLRSEVLSSSTSWAAPAGTFPDNTSIEWQVRTKGSNATASNWSATAVFETVGDPNAQRARLRATWMDLDTGESSTAPMGSLTPIGLIAPFAGALSPPGWLICDGQALEQADYVDLFGVIGTRFNTGGETATQFRLPDFRDRFAAGSSAGKSLGSRGGSATSTIGTSNLPPHVHGIDHVHELDFSTAVGNSGGNIPLGTTTFDRSSSAAFTYDSTGKVSGYGPGSSAPLSVLNPYLAVNYIIKI